MGLIFARFELADPRRPEHPAVEIQALVDTGALHLCLPRSVAESLGLDLEGASTRKVTLADGTERQVPYAGPVEVRFGDRACFTGALVLGDRVLMGAVPLEDLDLVVSPARRSLTVNPASPDAPSSIVMPVAARGERYCAVSAISSRV